MKTFKFSFFIILILSACSKKTEYIPFQESHFIIIYSDARFDLVSNEDKKTVIKSFSNYQGVIQVDGIHRFIPQNDTDRELYSFQIKCLTEWKCPEGIALLSRGNFAMNPSFSYGENPIDTSFAYLVNKTNLKSAHETLTFLNQPNIELPSSGFNKEVFSDWIKQHADGNRYALVNLYYLFESWKNKVYDPEFNKVLSRAPLSLKRLSELKDEKEIESYVLSHPIDQEILNDPKIREAYQHLIDENLATFFHIEQPIKVIQNDFETFASIPYLKELAFQKIMESGEFVFDPPPPSELIPNGENLVLTGKDWTINVKRPRNVKLQFKFLPGKEWEIKNIQSITNDESLVFKITTVTEEEFQIKSRELPKVFDGAERMKKFAATLPKKANEIIDEYASKSTKEAGVYLALKFGKGGFDSQSNNYVYELDDPSTIHYLFKNNHYIKADKSEISGDLFGKIGDDYETIQLEGWYQKYNKETKEYFVFLNFTEIFCGCDCSEYKKREQKCWNSGNLLKVKFPASAVLNKDFEDTKLEFESPDSNACDKILNY